MSTAYTLLWRLFDFFSFLLPPPSPLPDFVVVPFLVYFLLLVMLFFSLTIVIQTWVVQTHTPLCPGSITATTMASAFKGIRKSGIHTKKVNLRNARSMANDNKILSTPQGWRFGELVAHEAEEGNHNRSFFPVSHCGCVIWIYKRKPFTPDFWVGLLDQPVSIFNHIHHTKHTLSTYFLLLSIDRRL